MAIEFEIENYGHPGSHPPSIITQDVDNRFVTDAQIAAWDAKASQAEAVAAIADDVAQVAADASQVSTDKGLVAADRAAVEAKESDVQDHAVNAAVSAVQSSNSAAASVVAKDAAVVAQGLAEDAQAVAEAIQLALDGSLLDLQVYDTAGTFVWNKPAGCTSVEIIVVGGGGAAGGITAIAAARAGGGGGAGSVVYGYIDSGLGATETITVGAGGLGVSADNGNPGENSSFGAHAIAEAGGGGYVGDSVVTAVVDGTNGYGGGNTNTVPTIGYGIKGGDGGSGQLFGTVILRGSCGFNSYGHNAEAGVEFELQAGSSANNGRAADGFGTGGGGSYGQASNSTAYAGEDGTSGLVIVKAYGVPQ